MAGPPFEREKQLAGMQQNTGSAEDASSGMARFDGCGKRPLDVLLFLNALYLAFLSGKVWRGVPVSDQLRRLCRHPVAIPSGVELRDLRCAVWRASRYAGRLGGLDSCVTRSLVMARLLLSRGNVAISIGFRTTAGAVEGHAWVCVDDRNVSDPDPVSVADEFLETHRLELRDYHE